MSTNYNSFSSNGGHSAKSPGACSGEYKEHEQTRLMNKAFIKAMKVRGYKVVDTTSDARNKSAALIEQVQKVNETAEDGNHLALSWHLNASGGTGTEVLCYSSSTQALAAKVSAAIAKTLGVRDRGAKLRPGLYFLKNCCPHALIIEVCFIDSPSDMEKLEAKRQLVAEAVADVLVGRPSSSKDSSTKPTASSTTAADSSTKPTSSTGQTAYSGGSLVDYLKSIHEESSFAARAELAVKHGIVKSAEVYDGTLSQNTALLAAMRKAVKQ